MNINLPVVFSDQSTKLDYLPTFLFTHYLDNLFNTYNICKYDYDNIIEHYFLEINVYDLTYKISNNFYTKILHCQEPIIIIPINLQFINMIEDNTTDNTILIGHANLIIIDKIKGVIELFEPHGTNFNHVNNLQYNTELLIEKTIKNIFPLYNHFVFHNVFTYCYLLPGVQGDDSYCLAWTLLLLELKILNPTVETSELLNIIRKMGYNNAIDYIRRYIFKIESTHTINLKKTSEYPVYILNLQLTDIIDKSQLYKRIFKLLNLYKQNVKLNNIKNNHIIFRELSYYMNIPDFNTLLIKFFKKF